VTLHLKFERATNADYPRTNNGDRGLSLFHLYRPPSVPSIDDVTLPSHTSHPEIPRYIHATVLENLDGSSGSLHGQISIPASDAIHSQENIMMVQRSQSMPYGALFIGIIGVAAVATGVLALTGIGADWHPLLASKAYGVAFMCVGLALSMLEALTIVRFARNRYE